MKARFKEKYMNWKEQLAVRRADRALERQMPPLIESPEKQCKIQQELANISVISILGYDLSI